MKFYVLLFVLMGFTVGCKDITTSDGRVPKEYIEMAKPYMGTFVGQFEKVPTQLSLSMDDTGYVRLSAANANGSDILGENCNSKIGSMKVISVSGSKQNPKVNRVEFNFDPNKCPIMGRSIVLEFDQSAVQARILHHTDTEIQCPGRYPTGGCTTENVFVYLNGVFKKQ